MNIFEYIENISKKFKRAKFAKSRDIDVMAK